MPREFVFASQRPIDLADQLLGAAQHNLQLGIRTVWNRGGVQILDADGGAVLTVLTSTKVETPGSAERLLASRFDAKYTFWTEAYGPAHNADSLRIARNIAVSAEGQLFVNGVAT